MKAILSLLVTLSSVQVFAAAAAEYNCVGKDSVSNQSVVFNLTFSDYDSEAGYTNQSITITKKGWETLENPIVFQMTGATKKNNCKKNEVGEIYLKDTFDMTPTAQSDAAADYKVTVKSDCADAKVDIKAYCAL